VETEWNSNR